MSSKLGIAAVRLTAASRQALHGAGGRAGLATTPAARGPGKEYAPVPKYLQEKMRQFQLPNNLPVHIKGGAVDKMLFLLTGTLCAVGLAECFHVYYLLSFPKSK